MFNNSFFSEEVRPATVADRQDLIHIIRHSFSNDPCFQWITEKSTHKNSLEELSRYVVEEALAKGRVYINIDKTAAALWHSEQQEAFSLQYIKRNIRFLLQLGLQTVKRSLNLVATTNKQTQEHRKYLYLSCIGVLPEAQGKGFAKKLILPMLNQAKEQNLAVFLETANTTNVSIYKKMGFNLANSITIDGLNLYYMRLS